MNAQRSQYDDEIDLMELFLTLWQGKWIIILFSILTVLIGGLIAVFVLPNSYKVSFPVYQAKSEIFTKYTTLNRVLAQNSFDYKITKDVVFNNFIAEFSDYEEIVAELEKIDNLTSDDNQSSSQRLVQINRLAKVFQLVRPSKDSNIWKLSFEWRDASEGKEIYQTALTHIMENVKAGMLQDVNALVNANKTQTKYQIEKVKLELSLLERSIQLDTQKQLLFLKEQSQIAKELDIEKNTLESAELAQSQPAALSLSVSSANVPFYLRGFKAIDKEIALIEGRSNGQSLALSAQFVQLEKQLAALENDITASQIETELKVLAGDNPQSWMRYDVEFADAKSTKSTALYLALSLIIGGIFGVLFVLTRSAIKNRQATKQALPS